MAKPADLDWNDLRYFLAAARARTLAGAARALGVEHSTIGRRLGALEEALGISLFTRGPDGLTLTVTGEAVAARAEEMDRAAHAVRELATAQQARVRLATPTGFSRYFHPHLVAFQAAHPGVTLEMLSGSRPVDLKKGEADLALRSAPVLDEELVARKIGDVGWTLYAADAYLARHPAPADPRALAGHDLIGYEASLAGVPGARFIAEHGQGANVIMRCREMTDVLSACAAGLGLAVIPCMAAEFEPTLRRLTPEVLGTHRLSLVYRKEVLVSEPVKAVIEFVLQVMGEHAGRMAGHSPPEQEQGTEKERA